MNKQHLLMTSKKDYSVIYMNQQNKAVEKLSIMSRCLKLHDASVVLSFILQRVICYCYIASKLPFLKCDILSTHHLATDVP